MNDWINQLAGALDVHPPSTEEVGAVLKLARDVAHGVERKLAPLSTYLVGVAVGAGTAPDSERAEAFRLAIEAAGPIIPRAGADPG
jgi:hypothetical protein